ncbi:MAG: response regulator, partial [Candidatus Omnitrophica bacterium]|nr:response regulator [Candidatus Omnitrophota bacterium]
EKRSQALLYAAVVHERLDSVVNLGISLATRPRFVEDALKGDWKQAISIFEGITGNFPFIQRLFVTDTNGIIVVDMPAVKGVVGSSRADKDWYKGVKAKWQPYVSDVYQRVIEPRYNIVSIAIPVKNSTSLYGANVLSDNPSKDVIGILVLQLKLDTFASWTKVFDVGVGGLMYIVDKSGKIVYHPKFKPQIDLVDFSGVPIIKKVLGGESGVEINFNPVEKEKRVAAYEPVTDYGWGVVVTQPAKIAFMPRDRDLLFFLIYSLLALFFSLTLGYLILFILTIRKKSEIALLRSSSFKQALLNTIPFGIDIVDNQGNIMYVNQILKNAIGENTAGKKCWEVYTDDKKQCGLCPLKTGFDIGETKSVEVNGAFGGKTFIIMYTGMIYDGKKSVMEAFIDITERKKAEQIVQQALNTKTVFTSMVSHELRTPLAAIKEGISIVLDGESGPINKEQKEFLDIAKRNVDRLNRLISEILDFQKLEAGKMALKKEENDINDVVREVYGTMLSLVQNKGLAFIIKPDADLPRIKFDKDKIIQVLNNLVSNAIKFTEKGSITVFTSRGDNFIRVSVQDTGPGIRSEDIPRLFREFEQLETGTDRKTGGTGLGLIISKEIIEGHKGKIWVESKIGEGSILHFVLPIEERRNNMPKTILLVEDEPDVARLTASRLKKAGYEILTATDGQEALDLLEGKKPDLILLDLVIPRVSGYDVAKKLKQDIRFKNIPIILFTASAINDFAQKLIETGAADYIIKPFEPGQLLEKIKKFIR